MGSQSFVPSRMNMMLVFAFFCIVRSGPLSCDVNGVPADSAGKGEHRP